MAGVDKKPFVASFRFFTYDRQFHKFYICDKQFWNIWNVSDTYSETYLKTGDDGILFHRLVRKVPLIDCLQISDLRQFKDYLVKHVRQFQNTPLRQFQIFLVNYSPLPSCSTADITQKIKLKKKYGCGED